MSVEFNFVHERVSEEDLENLLGPFEEKDGPLVKFDDSWTMAHIMHSAGIFKSVTEARKNGWNMPVPKGFSHHVVTKRKINIWILGEMI